MIIAKQMDIRSNIKKYFDIAYNGEAIIVPRKENKNVVIISENEYNRINSTGRLTAYAGALAAGRYGKSPGTTTTVREENKEKLKVIRSLKDNWNGNGAPAFPEQIIARADALIDALLIQPELFPTALQTIQFEYDNSRRDHMEIEIGASPEAEIFVATCFGNEYGETVPATPEAISERILQFYG